MNFLLDTCAVCEAGSARPNQRVVDWLDALPAEETFLSCITIGEIQRGIAMLPVGRKRNTLEIWFQTKIIPQFAGRIVEIEAATMLRWGTFYAELEQRGQKMPLTDSLIAATALVHGLTLVTRNESDFAHSGVRVFNPWR